MGGGVRGEGGGEGNKYAQHMRERRMEDEERLINERIMQKKEEESLRKQRCSFPKAQSLCWKGTVPLCLPADASATQHGSM